MKKQALLLAALVPFLGACEESTGPEDAGRVTLRFNAVAPTGTSASQSPASGVSFNQVPARAITLKGTNGTLVLQDLRLIVSEIELRRAGVVCVGEEDNDECEEFEGGPFLVDLLDGRVADVVTGIVPEGLYTALEFEVENLDADEDDTPAERQAIQNIFTQVRTAFPNFPNEASMVVRGTFAPTGGTAQPFTVFFDAEIEVEKEFPAPLRVPEDAGILVNLNPAAFFQQGGQVANLLALNGQLVEFEAQFESVFKGGIGIQKDD